ncbi:flagellar biosynthesis anti-sigma factor FlgM [Cohnella zeiphila]|nr:flagellar biosynthesis anti-sigma factor FlgM [Cohnella zeiphila]
MKINDTQRIGMYKSYSPTTDTRVRTGSSGSRRDQLQISEEAKELLGAQGKSDAERADKIESLKSQVKSGTYFVDAGKIAEKLLPYLK